jgi:Cellulose binding domain
LGRHLAGLGGPDEATDAVEWTPAHADRHPVPWRLVLALGVPLGLVVGGIVWATNGEGWETDGPAVVVQDAAARPTEWVPDRDVGPGGAVPTATSAPTPTPTVSPSQEQTSPRASEPAPPPPAVFSARYALTTAWSGGFAATLVIANVSGQAGSWQVRLDYPSPDKVTVTEVTNATFSVGGGKLIFSGGRLPAGQQVTVRFEAENRPGQTSPTSCTVNGVDCAGL